MGTALVNPRVWRGRFAAMTSVVLVGMGIAAGSLVAASPASAAGGSVRNVTAGASPEATGNTSSTYTISFVATDGLSGTQGIQISAPTGTDFGNIGDTVTDNTNPTDSGSFCTGLDNTPNVVTIGGNGFTCHDFNIPAGDSLTVTLTDVTNPSTPGLYTLLVQDGADTNNVASSQYRIAPEGYWLVGSDGGIFTFGSAQFYGSTGSLVLQRPVVGIVPTADRGGYWLDASDGGVFSFGDTQFYGSIPGLGIRPAGSGGRSLNAPIVGMVPSVDDRGYFMVGADGGVFAFGDAKYEGSCPGIGGCVGAAVAVMPDASGLGYWLVTSLGAVYTFGDAKYLGAPGNTGSAVTSAVGTPDGNGYWTLDAAGHVHAYGDAKNLGNDNNVNPPSDSATAIFTDIAGDGYGVSDQFGGVAVFGGVPKDGGMDGTKLNGAIISASGY